MAKPFPDACHTVPHAANRSFTVGKVVVIHPSKHLTRTQIAGWLAEHGAVRLGVDTAGRDLWVDADTRGGGIYSRSGRGWAVAIG